MVSLIKRPTLSLFKTSTTRWVIERSHMVAVPKYLEVSTMEELRSRVRRIAQVKQVRVDRPPIDQLTFRYELDNMDNPNKVFVFFTDRHGKQRRFMRLIRES